ncbi:MAG: hypothetical protein R3E18_12375 [Sphingomonadaceae bacterium]
MINAAALLRHDFGETTHCWDRRDAILYALGVGMGHDPMDREDLRYLDERELSVLPSMAVTLASPGMWIRNPKFGITFGKLVHSAQSARFANPLPPEGTVVGTARVTSLPGGVKSRPLFCLLCASGRGVEIYTPWIFT